MTHYGRPGTDKRPSFTDADSIAVQNAASRILALGGALIAGFLITMAVPWKTGTEQTAFPEGEIPVSGVTAVMSTAVTERETLAELPENRNDPAADTGVEPFGYLDGEWNLWEYIGDLMWSLLS